MIFHFILENIFLNTFLAIIFAPILVNSASPFLRIPVRMTSTIFAVKEELPFSNVPLAFFSLRESNSDPKFIKSFVVIFILLIL